MDRRHPQIKNSYA